MTCGDETIGLNLSAQENHVVFMLCERPAITISIA